MKKYFLVFILVIWICTACSPQTQAPQQALLPNPESYPNPSYPNPSYPNTSYPNGDSPTAQPSVNLTPAESAAIAALAATLSLPAEQIKLVSAEAMEWRDGCLGVQKIGVMCTQAVVPGFKIVLQANGALYEYHTNKDGQQMAEVGEVAPGDAVQKAVIKQLASNLGLQESDISVVSTATVEFPDSCMGVAMENMACSQLVTSGQIIVLQANDLQYEYHVNSDGSTIQPATIALTWKREGGIAGFCDNLTVFLSGEVYGSKCKPQSNEAMGSFAKLLSAAERDQFNNWFKELGQANLDASNPVGVSDRMVVTLAFYGSGSGTIVKSNEQDLFMWAQDLYQKHYP